MISTMKRKKSPVPFRKSGAADTSTPKSVPPSTLLVSTPVSTTIPHVGHLTPTVHSSSDDLPDAEDIGDIEAALSNNSLLSAGSIDVLHCLGTSTGDDTDAGLSYTPDLHRTKAAIDHIQQKVVHAKELIKAEQTARDDNVNEYLKLATNADKQQLQRIKNVFEKKNQKSAQTIAQLQKKLENYQKRIRDLETYGLPRGMLRDVGQGLKDVRANIKEGITGLSGGMVGNLKGGLSAVTHTAAETVKSKPREFAHLLKNRFGSADNINSVGKTDETSGEDAERNLHGSATFTHSTKYTSEDDSSSMTSESGQLPICPGTSNSPQHQPLVQSLPSVGESTLHTMIPATVDLEPILQELRSQREEYQHLAEDIETFKSQLQQECTFFNQAMQEERYRYERLEEQMNDLIELHQNEIENLKQGIADMEEKVQYQSEERLRDVHDVLESCQTRISRMEHQQHQHLQQLVTLDSLENSQARALVLKLINVVLTVLQVVLLLVATLANIVMPFLQTRVRILTTILLVSSVILIIRQWPELLEWCRDWASHYLQNFPR